jgi:tetratricopeptide (TPR) repeat protein
VFKSFRRKPLTPYQEAVRLLDTANPEEAERRLSALADVESDVGQRAAIFNKRGVARVRLGRRDDALADFQTALELRPDYPPSLVNVGNLLLEDGKLDAAIVQYERAVRVDDEYSIAHLNLSAAYKKAGRHEDAVREYRRAGKLEGRMFGKPTKPRGY